MSHTFGQRRAKPALLLVLGALCLLAARTVEAADQTEHLKKPPTVLANPGDYIDLTTGTLSYEKARSLVRVAFPNQETNEPDFYCAIHVVRWGDDPSTVDKSHWYIYRGRGSATSYAGRWTAARFAGARIYGSDTLAVLYVHVNVPALTRAAAIKQVEPQLVGSAETVKSLLPEGEPPKVKSDRGKDLRELGPYFVEAEYTNISYQIDVVKKLPAPIQNLQDAIGMVQGREAPKPSLALVERVGLYAGDVYDIRHVPSDITITGTLTTTSTANVVAETKKVELGKQTYDNEGLYYWDISLGIPVTSVTQLDFETSGGQVFAKEVDKAKLLALLNVFWRPIDTKNTKLMLTPSPIVGVALSKNPLDKILVGLSIGLNKVQAYGGYQWSQIDKAPVPGAEAVAPDTNKTEYKGNWVAGINVPVRQVIDFLKAKK